MNKTVTCTISGAIFNLEEQAYDLLLSYLNKLKKHLSNIEGGDEIYSDIELRILELFSERLTKHKEVITRLDVEEVVKQLGNPEDYIDGEATEATERKTEKSESSGEKQFMRDPDNGILGGVCKGLSVFFGIDLTIIRILFIVFAIVPGFGVLLYIILWIITPKAKTHADRLRMSGKPVNIDMMIKEVEKAAEKAAKKVENYSKTKFRKENFEGVINRTNKVGRFFVALIGVILTVGAVVGIITFVGVTMTNIGLFTSNDGEQLISLHTFSKIIFNSGGQYFIAWIGIMGIVLLPLLAFFTLGLSLILKLKSPWLKFTYIFFFVAWMVSISMVTITGIQVGREFTHLGESETFIATIDTKHLTVDIPSTFSDDRLSSFNNNTLMINGTNASLIDLLDEDVKSGWVQLEVKPSKDSFFHIYRETQARGITPKQGLRRTMNIVHELTVEDSLVVIDPFYTYPLEDKLRNQVVRIVIEQPEGAKISWSGNRKQLIMSKRTREMLR